VLSKKLVWFAIPFLAIIPLADGALVAAECGWHTIHPRERCI
jgi:hypothetical protein